MQDELFLHQFYSVKSKFEIQSVNVYNQLLEIKNTNHEAPYLSQLLLRIDYNGYFTNLAEKVQQRAYLH